MRQIEMPQRDSEGDKVNHSPPEKQTGIPAYFSPPPRVRLFFLVLLIQLAGAAVGGLFLMAIPATDRLLQSAIKWLKPVALTILTILLLVGIGEIAFLQSGWWGTESSQLLDALHRVFIYNDGAGLL